MANNKKQFGVWMDGTSAFVVGRENISDGDFQVLAQIGGEKASYNSNENAANNHQRTLEQKYFKEITSKMQNAEVVHITGTGKIQEQFVHYLADTPQFKNTQTSTSTSNKMSEQELVEFFTEEFGK